MLLTETLHPVLRLENLLLQKVGCSCQESSSYMLRSVQEVCDRSELNIKLEFTDVCVLGHIYSNEKYFEFLSLRI